MGFFDRLTGKKATQPTATPSASIPAGGSTPLASNTTVPNSAAAANPAAGGVIPRLGEARRKLDEKDLPGAIAIYEEVLAGAGDRADILVTISGDLGSSGNVEQIVELIAPRYDAQRHGPATGINLLQAYLAMRQPGAAQHVLDILFSLGRPDLEERLYGFSNAIADLMAVPEMPAEASSAGPALEPPKIGLVTISRPIWSYGLEPMADAIQPPKASQVRRVSFTQLALPTYRDIDRAMRKPEDELARLSRSLPFWLAETFYFCPHYASSAAVGLLDDPAAGKFPALFPTEWSTDNLRQLVETSDEEIDYIFTGALRHAAGDYDLVLRVFEVKKFRERKMFTARWTPATADAELARLHEQIRTFMEWKPAEKGLRYAMPARPRAWLDTLGTSVTTFLAGKALIAKELVVDAAVTLDRAAQEAASSEMASLAFLTLRHRLMKLEAATPIDAPLFASPLVDQARDLLK